MEAKRSFLGLLLKNHAVSLSLPSVGQKGATAAAQIQERELHKVMNTRRCGLLRAGSENQLPFSTLWPPLNHGSHIFKIYSLSETPEVCEGLGLGSKSRTLTPKSSTQEAPQVWFLRDSFSLSTDL